MNKQHGIIIMKGVTLMPSIASHILGENLQNIPNGTGGIVQHLTAPTTVLRPQFIPGNYSFSVLIGVKDVDLQKENAMQIVLKSPTGDVVQMIDKQQIPVSTVDSELPDEYAGFMLGVDFRNVPFVAAGCYTLEVIINEELIGAIDVPVFRKAE